ncbi:2-octaprenyl-6-methoxyphenyl hydroxylase [Candidatus Erwinia dacicola]|uniref:2-octaprenyl-6-methoxyphenyl hydroxylase n=1 Tax=Candidatus Erwinia dacicola TaxID=252393 RepID=A0A1E7Z3M3_9GAMM|nr:2-octaprenyl-6-methoxyphenyl hydroxylase [Candidatus Erwinia dacicola]NJC99390.1 2-octaprenyl-6-methoxyphenyl hydroxylase [Candidatus Erwinia dacicola]OFC63369.1 2-octaprenyl-6-methoxyphenyl hydroxylase [Candidatus Erwinia dacicola]RAP72318.1 2-polyprenyl-6-methoxyphenol 4-hydroxylase [Candidatus Erwinia dacicola]RAP72377.1 2-polyprenyl-6-methoxyphenol 4-hydroxylase [Candidatus Erwinia dacicola]
MSIIIAGGGMTGATLALAISHLTQGKLTVTLVEATEPASREHPGYDGRAIALAEGTCQQLAAIDLWPLLASCTTAITDVHVSDRGHANFVSLSAADYGVSALGQVVELHEVGQRLFNRLKQVPGITLRCPDKVAQVTRAQDSVSVTLASGETLSGELLVAADGSHSQVATACGMSWQRTDYQQVAVIANISTQLPHQGRAFERFTEHGPLALLPMSDGRSSLVWCHPLAQKSAVDGWEDRRFIAELQRTFGWRLGRITHVGQRHSYPLQLQTAAQHVGHRLALVGNAAQTLHPIAGQGFNIGIRDVMSLAETLAAAWRAGQGAFATLQHYQQRRQPDAQATIGITDGLVRLFANRYTPLVIGRNLGLLAMDHLPLLRNLLAERTLGWIKR